MPPDHTVNHVLGLYRAGLTMLAAVGRFRSRTSRATCWSARTEASVRHHVPTKTRRGAALVLEHRQCCHRSSKTQNERRSLPDRLTQTWESVRVLKRLFPMVPRLGACACGDSRYGLASTAGGGKNRGNLRAHDAVEDADAGRPTEQG